MYVAEEERRAARNGGAAGGRAGISGGSEFVSNGRILSVGGARKCSALGDRGDVGVDGAQIRADRKAMTRA